MWTPLKPRATVAVTAGLLRDRLGTITRLSLDHPEGVILRLPRRRLIVLGDAAAVRHVLVENARGYAKGLGQAEAARWLGDGILTAEGEAWRQQRPDVAGALSARQVHQVAGGLAALASSSVDAWLRTDWHSLDPREHLAQYTLDALGLVMGFDAPAASEVVEAFERIQRRVMFDTSTQALVPTTLRPADTLRVRAGRRHLERIAERSLRHRGTDAAWAHPVRMLSLMLAGYETTASTLGWALSRIAGMPLLQRDLATEAHRSAQGPPGTLGERPLASAVFRESVRLNPPVWLISRRALLPDTIDGNQVYPGDDIAICTHAIHRDSSWGDSATGETLRFRPGRADRGRRLEFGQGPRSCPGGSFAELEATLWLATACRRLEFEPVIGSSPRPVARLSQAPGPFEIRVRSRDSRPAGEARIASPAAVAPGATRR
jgi:cytochrome P450